MTTRLPRGMLIDLDGTIIDSKLTAEEAWMSVCREVAPRLDTIPEELRGAISTAADWFWSDPQRGREGRADLRTATRQIVERALGGVGTAAAQLAAEIANQFRDRRDQFALLPGAVEAIEALRARHISLALMTNGAGPVQREKIDRFDLCRHFDCVLIEGELGFGKPDERIYRNAMATLRTAPSDTWAVGDNLEWEVAAPQRLGIYGVWVDSTGSGLPPGREVRPDRIIRSLADLLREADQ